MCFQDKQQFNDFTGLGMTQSETETGGGPRSGGTVFEKPVVG